MKIKKGTKENKKFLISMSLLLGVAAIGAIFINTNIRKRNGTGKKQVYPKLVVVGMSSSWDMKEFEPVEEAVNTITRKELGVEVDFRCSGGSDYNEAVELLLTSGEQVDILCGSNTLFMKTYINRRLCDLEPLLNVHGQDIIKAVGWKAINCCRIGGVLYGLPNNRDYAAGWDSYALRKDVLSALGIKAEEITSIEDLEEVFERVLEEEPGMIPLACTGSLFGNFALADGINSFPAGGHENYGQDEAIVNIFETEEYLSRLKQVRKWYLKGYLGKNILENTVGVPTMIRNGEVFCEAVKNKPGMQVQESLKCGREMEIVQFGESAISYNSMAAYPWMITKNTISKELSMGLLNLFYSNADIMNLLSYGIEGEDYIKTEKGYITLPEGKKYNLYFGMAWIMPNQFITDVWEGNPPDLWERMRKYNENALQSCEIGFNFNVFPVAKQYLELEEIYSSYKPILESGLVNPEKGLKQMLDELKAHGLEEVIGEKRKQYNFWKQQEKQKK